MTPRHRKKLSKGFYFRLRQGTHIIKYSTLPINPRSDMKAMILFFLLTSMTSRQGLSLNVSATHETRD